MAKFTKAILRNSSITLFDFYDIIKEAKSIHNISNELAEQLGKVFVFAEYMCSYYKSEKDTLSVTVVTNSGNIVVVGNGNHKIKGYIDQLDLSQGINGIMVVIKGENLKKPYTGKCNFSIALEDAFVNYFEQSEQNELHVDIQIDFEKEYAKAVFSQFLPGATQEDMLYKDKCFIEMDNEHLFNFYLNNAEILSIQNFELECDCSKEKIDRAIISLGPSEAKKIVEENGKIEVKCEFCQTNYSYCKKDLEILFEEVND